MVVEDKSARASIWRVGINGAHAKVTRLASRQVHFRAFCRSSDKALIPVLYDLPLYLAGRPRAFEHPVYSTTSAHLRLWFCFSNSLLVWHTSWL